MHAFDFIFTVITPVLALLGLGFILYRGKHIGDEFVEHGSKLVFNIALPALLFISISTADFSQAADLTLLLVGTIGTLVFFMLLVVAVPWLIQRNEARGVVIQGSFRANMGVIGLSYCANTYGTEGLAAASVYLGCVTILYNVLSVCILSYYQKGIPSLAKLLGNIARNPLIIAIVCALPLSYWQVSLPEVITSTGHYFAQLTLPLALICTGASLDVRHSSNDKTSLFAAVAAKCVVYPVFMVVLAYSFDLRGMALGIVMLMAVAPTAAASYVMTRYFGGDHKLAAAIIATTTVLSVPITIAAFGGLSMLGIVELSQP